MATIRDVARLAGVAPMTVSRVLNHRGYVSPETRARVEQAAAELNYVPNMLANSLRSQRTHTIALVMTDITNPFWTTIARGVEDVASEQGYTVIFCNTDESEPKQAQYVSMLLRRRVDGVLLAPASSSPASVHALLTQNVRLVLLDRLLPGIAVDSVRGDSVQGARLLVEHLLALGHRRIAMLAGPPELSVSTERVGGYCAGMAAAGLAVDETLIFYGSFNVDSGRAMAQAALQLSPRPTAILAASNFIAYGALAELEAAHLAAPADLSIVAFDDLPYSQTPFLTVARQPAYAMGQAAAQLLLRRIDHPDPQACEEVVLPVEIIVRASTQVVASPARSM